MGVKFFTNILHSHLGMQMDLLYPDAIRPSAVEERRFDSSFLGSSEAPRVSGPVGREPMDKRRFQFNSRSANMFTRRGSPTPGSRSVLAPRFQY